jgi:aminoglycoside phosphotransferase (APT) family kinase protein
VAQAEDPAGLRMAELARWLVAAGISLDASSPLKATLFPSGRSNVTYLVTDAAGSSVVIRRPPLGNVLPSAHDMAREHRVLSGLARADFPAPRPLALCADDDVIGAPFLVMEFVDGPILSTDEDVAALQPADLGRASESLVETLAQLHRLDLEAAGLAELGRPQGYLARQATRWAQQWDLTKTRELDTMDELRRRVEALVDSVPPDGRAALVHGDYRLDNVILTPGSWEARAVLDWEMSTLGDPLADLALMLVYWSEPGDVARHRVPIADNLTEADGFWGRQRIIDQYASLASSDLEQLDACTALACYKLAVIAESIHARTLSGKQLGAAATGQGGMGEAAEALARMGLAVTEMGTVAGLAS